MERIAGQIGGFRTELTALKSRTVVLNDSCNAPFASTSVLHPP